MENTVDNPLFYPMLVAPDGTTRRLTPAEDRALWEKYKTLPRERQDQITAQEVVSLLSLLQQQYRISTEMMGQVSLCIRSLFFGELNISQAEAKIGALLAQTGGGDPNKAKEMAQFIDREILHLVPKPVVEETNEFGDEGEVKGGTLRVPLLRAMTDYPQLGMQPVTTNKIRLKGQAEPQRPTLSNWIKYYRDELGIGFHDEVKRGQFLFQSDNGRKLSGEERDRLNLILKSIEEDFPLDIDTARQVIVFPARTPASPATPQAPASAPSNLTFINQPRPGVPAPTQGKSLFTAFGSAPGKNVANETLHFSTGHVMPAEQAKTTPASPTPAPAPQPPKTTPPRNPYIIRPLRLRNDRDEGK